MSSCSVYVTIRDLFLVLVFCIITVYEWIVKKPIKYVSQK